jgi:serine/threonine protein kinase
MKYKINPLYKDKLEKFFLDIKCSFYENNNSIHKARNELKIIAYSGIDMVVKSFKVPNFINSIVYSFFRDSKAKKSYEYALKIGDFTPIPIGYIEFYSAKLFKESYFISEKFSYDFTIREPLLDQNFEDREAILRAFATFSYKLHEAGIFHDDYSPGNILIKKNGEDYEFKIVDINRMKFFTFSASDRAKNFAKLWAKDEDLRIVGDEYIKHFEAKEDFVDLICHYSLQNKKIKNFKKRLKGKEIDW